MEADPAAALAVLAAELDRIEDMPGSAGKSAAIKALAALPGLADRLAGLRRDEVLRLRAEELLSLGKTADRVGISKGRAQQYEDERKRREARDGQRVHDGG